MWSPGDKLLVFRAGANPVAAANGGGKPNARWRALEVTKSAGPAYRAEHRPLPRQNNNKVG